MLGMGQGSGGEVESGECLQTSLQGSDGGGGGVSLKKGSWLGVPAPPLVPCPQVPAPSAPSPLRCLLPAQSLLPMSPPLLASRPGSVKIGVFFQRADSEGPLPCAVCSTAWLPVSVKGMCLVPDEF